MTLRSISSVVALLAIAALSSAWANTQVLARYGKWQAFGGSTNDGTPVCGVSSSGDGLYFGMKVFAGDDTVTLQLGSTRWNLNKGDKVRVYLAFDNYPRWIATATGMHFSDGDAGLEFTVGKNDLRRFITEFRASYRMTVSFGGSGMSDWTGDLTGTNAVTDVFARCVGNM